MARIGVVGVGGMGRGHCNTLPKVDNCDFVGVADLRLEAAEEVAAQHGAAAFDDYRRLFEQVDGVVVATPPATHREVTVAAAEMGVHVFCEKPLSLNMADSDAMIEATDAAGVHLMVGMVLRFYPVHTLARRLVDDGEIGRVVYIEGDYTNAYRGPRKRPESWYGSVGGYLENGIHKVDLVNWFGGTAQTVTAEVGSFSGHDDWEDYALTLLRYGADTTGILRWGPFMGARGTNETIIDGSEGSLRLSIREDTAYLKKIGEADWTEIVPDRSKAHGVAGELTHFVECIESGGTPLVDGRAGRHAVEVVLASYRSAKTHAKIDLPITD
ncbi:Gfo/Idh/MocA family oxidoreductase [Candidatus Poribacteria bacterium]|jgi:UDP-N-acetylglucosamine 3-dehydrogenase|nr:Gfo/Idh/MocA family oxidoreductase [Candidatus Poribacteria bacterium]MBT7805785.1 Gfo/Idh/MocA family oxidoreductase [Candidatus Poribacteria bacterium]